MDSRILLEGWITKQQLNPLNDACTQANILFYGSLSAIAFFFLFMLIVDTEYDVALTLEHIGFSLNV